MYSTVVNKDFAWKFGAISVLNPEVALSAGALISSFKGLFNYVY
jgi:hypothetical protein